MRLFSKDQLLISLLLGLVIFFIALSRQFHPFGTGLRASPANLITKSHPQWVVEVAGDVKNPGIYTFSKPPTARQAILSAGRPIKRRQLPPNTTEDPLTTGTRVNLRASGPCDRVTISAMNSRKRLVLGIPIHLNQAGADDLAMIPGISPRLAQRIFQFREAYGPFKSWKDLKRVNGIGPKKLAVVQSYLTLE